MHWGSYYIALLYIYKVLPQIPQEKQGSRARGICTHLCVVDASRHKWCNTRSIDETCCSKTGGVSRVCRLHAVKPSPSALGDGWGSGGD
jgi:MinD superfamily P-loop ATPase